MAARTSIVDSGVHDYLLASSREPDVLARLRAATAPLRESEMQIGSDQGQLMGLLAQLIGARRCLEIGTFTGYSSLAVMLALPKEATLIACDISGEWTDIARSFWREAGVEHRIDLRLQPALKTLDELLAAGEKSRFDFAFIDADKDNYVAYYEKLLQLVRPGGLIAVDNTLAVSGRPIYRGEEVAARALRAFNKHLHHDERVDLAMVSIGEGLTLARVR
jgi:caffeoyl-CoA O-methyltransferase